MVWNNFTTNITQPFVSLDTFSVKLIYYFIIIIINVELIT
jgi:hypothetical protein